MKFILLLSIYFMCPLLSCSVDPFYGKLRYRTTYGDTFCKRSTRRRLSSVRCSAFNTNNDVLMLNSSKKSQRANKNDPIVSSSEVANKDGGENKFWPPWPFNLLKRKPDTLQVSKATLISAYLRQRAILCMSGIQTVASEASLHFPPAGPALLLLAFAPRTRTSRRLVFASLSLALMSWGHDELTRCVLY